MSEKFDSLREKIALLKRLKHDVSDSISLPVPGSAKKQPKEKTALSFFRQAMEANELPKGKIENAYKVSLARTKNSGCSFGLCQFDVAHNSMARVFLDTFFNLNGKDREIFLSIRGKDLEYDDDGKAIIHDKFIHLSKEEKHVVDLVNAELAEERVQQELDILDNNQLVHLLNHVNSAFSSLGEMTIEKTIHLADMANQYGFFNPNGGTIKAFKHWMSLSEEERGDMRYFPLKEGEAPRDLFWAWQTKEEVISKVNPICSPESWSAFFLFFKLRTKHGKVYPFDPIRRWKNIHSVVNH